jgi:hypothetical protein
MIKQNIFNMSKIGFLVVVVLFVGMFSSCDSKDGKSKQGMLFTSGGRPSEVLVVMPKQNWKMTVGDTIRNTLGETPLWMAQNEPEYRLSQIEKSQFGKIFQKFRNILIVEFDESLTKTKITVQQNVHARPQTIVKIQSPNLNSFLTAYTHTYKQIKTYYHKNELLRISEAYKKMEVKKISKKMREKYSFKMVLPEGFFIAVDKKDFMWLRRPTREVEEGILIYSYPYTDTSDFNYHRIITLRDSLTKIYIPGPVDGSYMKVSSFFPPVHNTLKFKGNYATEIRSLWDVHGYAMGGPFMSYSFVDTIAGRMIMIDGFVKAPRKPKRDLMLRIEAMLTSFEFINSGDAKLNEE